MYVIDPLEVEVNIPTNGADENLWGIKLNHVLVNMVQPKINEIIEYGTLNNDVYGGSASTVYLSYQSLNGGCAWYGS